MRLQEHWLTIRRIGGSWYNFNSLYPAPEFLGMLYLTAFLATLREQGYSIFVVNGTLPGTHPDAGSDGCPGQWFTPQQARETTKGAVNARESGYLKAAISNCMEKASEEGRMVTLKPRSRGGPSLEERTQPSRGQHIEGNSSDSDLARAIAASLENEDVSTSGSFMNDENDNDPELAAALAASLADRQAQNFSTQAAEETTELDAVRLAALDPGPEPPPGPGSVDLALRLPNGERLMRRFRATDCIQDVLNFLRWRHVDLRGLLLTAFPRRVLDERQRTLRAAGIHNMETLTLQKASL